MSLFNVSSQILPFQAKISFKSIIPNIMNLKYFYLPHCPFLLPLFCIENTITNKFIKQFGKNEWPNLKILFIIKAINFWNVEWKKALIQNNFQEPKTHFPTQTLECMDMRVPGQPLQYIQITAMYKTVQFSKVLSSRELVYQALEM